MRTDMAEMKKPAARKPAAKKEKQNKYICVRNPLFHPFKNVTIGALPVELFPDSWLDSQVKAGLIKCQ